MQFSVATVLACFFALIASVMGQSAVILSPTENANVATGQPFTVQVAVPNQLTGLEEFSVTVALLGCAGYTCTAPASEALRHLLAVDKNFSPQYHEQTKPPYSNYSVTLPSNTAKGPNTIAIARFYLLGAGYEPILEFKNVTINIV